MSTYVRTQGGRVVHRAGCRYATTGVPWAWASGKTLTEIDQELRALQLSYRCCLLCFPMTPVGQRRAAP